MSARPGSRGRLALTVAVTAIVSIVCCVLAPLRELSGDTVPGRVGAAVLRCGGDFDLSRVDWIRKETDRNRMFYYMQPDEADEYSSIFGPVPAVVGAIALLDFGSGDTIDDATLRKRERYAAALLVGLAVVLLTLAAAARCGLARSALVGGVAAASFAGAATLGQGLWQATTALPFLVGAVTTLAWRPRFPRLALVTPALLLLAVMMRPTIAPIALGIGLAWTVGIRSWRAWAAAAAIALVAAAPLVAWNLVHLWSPFPVGQWHGNTRVNETVFSIKHVGVAVGGLLVSPGRGLLWFAPIVVVGVVRAVRSKQRALRWIAGGVVLQLLAMSAFFKWHGGLAFGPRLLAEASWIGIWLALGTGLEFRGRVSRVVTGAAVAVTIVVGQLGLWRFETEQWETRRRPEAHQEAFWDFVDSPIGATLTSSDGQPRAHDSPPVASLTCDDRGRLRSAPRGR